MSEILVEVFPKPDIGNVKIWSIKDTSGRAICYINASSPLKECAHHLSTTHQVTVNYKLSGEWPEGSSGLYAFNAWTNEQNRKLVYLSTGYVLRHSNLYWNIEP